MQYTLSMTSRMLALAALCLFLLCVLLFLLGIELGKRIAEPAEGSAPSTVNLPAGAAAAVPPVPAVPAAPALPAAPAVPALPKP